MSISGKWDKRFAGAEEPGPVTALVASGRDWLPTTGRALDLACGVSGTGLFLATSGLHCELWDNSSVALQKQSLWALKRHLPVDTCLRDCEARPPKPNSFDVICVAHFLHRPLCRALTAALRPGGKIFYQTFTQAGSSGPSNPDFLLKEGELRELFHELKVCYYRENFKGRAQLIAERD
jgi:2-polyprenyl-3-methyl-5-hydroxy-6-metoxy-1,4-benzoquinol methylase